MKQRHDWNIWRVTKDNVTTWKKFTSTVKLDPSATCELKARLFSVTETQAQETMELLQGKMPAQERVRDFHEALGIPIGESKALRDHDLRVELVREETSEFCEAVTNGDFVEAIDGAADVLVVILGAMVTFGINIKPFFDEVMRTNVAKKGGPIREDGKRLKPDGWQPPRIAELLEKHP